MSLLIQIEAPVIVAADGLGSVCGWRSPEHLLCPYCKANSAVAARAERGR